MLFLDSAFILAHYIKSDIFHKKSMELYDLIEKEELLTNNVVITEVLNSFKNNKHKVDVNKLYEGIIKSSTVDYLSPEDYKKSLDKLNWYNQAINYADCCNLTTMEKYQVTDIVSFDSDFDKINGICRIYL